MKPEPFRIGALLLAALAGGALLGGCPIPQPLPGVGSIDGGLPITPPRILTTSAEPGLAMTDYGPLASCPPGSLFEVSAVVIDENSEEPVEVRWFVDYAPDNQLRRTPLQIETLPPPADPQQYKRFPKAFPFAPWDFDSATDAGARGGDDHLERLPARRRRGSRGGPPQPHGRPGVRGADLPLDLPAVLHGRVRTLAYLVGCAASRAWAIASAAARARSPCSSANRFTCAV